MEAKKAQILLSTYNGERFLREQLDSLMRQTWGSIEVLARDDGSSDGTVGILREYAGRYGNIRVYPEENKGVAESFFELLKKSDADYVAFCDQDDVWLEDKLETAVARLETESGPALYCGNKILVDSDLEPLAKQDAREKRPGFGNAVVECICTGCTAVMNRKLADIMRARLPEHAIMHDWWAYLAASYVGNVIFDKEAHILYRQHGGNVVGAKGGFWGELRLKAAYLKKSRGKLRAQLSDFSRLYHGDAEKDALVRKVLAAESGKGRLRIAGSREIYRQSLLDGAVMRALFLAGRML